MCHPTNSFHDLTNSSRPLDTSTKSRRKTLTYGVSEHDLKRARETISSHHSTNVNFFSTKSPANSFHFQLAASNSSARSVHVSFLSPPVQSYAELPSFSSTTSSLPYLPSESSETHYYNKLSSKSNEKRPSSSTFNSKSSPSYPSLSLTYPSISPTRGTSRSAKAEALVLLKKQDLNEMINSSKSSYNHVSSYILCITPNSSPYFISSISEQNRTIHKENHSCFPKRLSCSTLLIQQ